MASTCTNLCGEIHSSLAVGRLDFERSKKNRDAWGPTDPRPQKGDAGMVFASDTFVTGGFRFFY